jgi:hypothetical protein
MGWLYQPPFGRILTLDHTLRIALTVSQKKGTGIHAQKDSTIFMS